MNDILRVPERAFDRIRILEVCGDDVDRQILQPADISAVGTNQTSDGKAKSEELFSRVTANESCAACKCDCVNGMILR